MEGTVRENESELNQLKFNIPNILYEKKNLIFIFKTTYVEY